MVPETGCGPPPSVFRGVQFDKVLEFRGVACDRTPLVLLHVVVGAAVAEDEAGGGEGRVVGADFAAQWADGLELRQEWGACPAVQVDGRRRGRQSCQGLDGLLVLRRVPPFQELEKEDAHGEAGGEGEGQAAQGFFCSRLYLLFQAMRHKTDKKRALSEGIFSAAS